MSGRPWQRLGWIVLVALSVYYLYRAIDYRFLTPGRLGTGLFDKQLWYIGHLVVALPVLVGGPLQFQASLRARRPRLHRLIGKAYVAGVCVTALTALYLGGLVGEYEGSILSIVLLACLWLFFTLAGWRCAVAGDYANHRLFMIRSYGLALVFVWLRVMYDLQDWLFFYVQDEAMRDATREWASWVVPLLVIEGWLSWWPALRRGRPGPAPER